MEYKLTSLEKKVTKTNKPYAVVFVTDAAGAEYKASMWENYDGLTIGGMVEGELQTKGDFLNFKRAGTLPRPNFYKPKADIAKAQEVKAQNIEAAQDRKHDAIAKAGAFRDATLVSLAELRDQPFPTEGEYKARWEYWVKYFLGKHEEPFV